MRIIPTAPDSQLAVFAVATVALPAHKKRWPTSDTTL
jgi:hypothetical protein